MSHTDPDQLCPPVVVLGSASLYRRKLLARLLPDFEVLVPAVDETALDGESGDALARRLALAKARAVAAQRPAAIVIGSDQVAECAGRILGKPGSAAAAIEQLSFCQGHQLTLHTAVCLIAPGGGVQSTLDQTQMQLRPLTRQQIGHYVDRDRPLDCAGSFRFEALGAALFTEVLTHDPTAIEGLPLLWLSGALSARGVHIL